jgi:glycosyltransferase involved in cell wall biosynthesis
MHIVFCVNHSWPFFGGCEIVVKQISERLVSQYGHKCTVLSRSFKGNERINNGVIYKSVNPSPNGFISQLLEENPDHLCIYSDAFYHWPTIVDVVDRFKFKTSIALVGMNHMRANLPLFNRFKANSDKFNVITHSDNYLDYLTCKHYGIPVNVIHNGVDLEEFEKHYSGLLYKGGFRQKYGINEKTIILCVSNFFPGKGQIETIPVFSKLKETEKNFIVVYICSTINFPLGAMLREKCRAQLKSNNIPHKILLDIPREDVIQSFLESYLFFFPSQKEVAPLVILEANAAGLPWVSLPVGNIRQLSGGIVVDSCDKDGDDNFVINDSVINVFKNKIVDLLHNDDSLSGLSKDRFRNDNLWHTLSKEGKKCAKEKFNLVDIVEQYNELFMRKN